MIYVYDIDEDDIEEPQVLYFLGLVREPPARILLLPLDCRFILELKRITCTIGLPNKIDSEFLWKLCVGKDIICL